MRQEPVLCLCLFAAVAILSPTHAREPIYQEDGKGLERAEHALEVAQKENKRVLLKIGGNWCGWCYLLNDTFHKDPKVRERLNEDYLVVMLDSKADKPTLKKWDIKPSSYPYLSVLDASGKKLVDQHTEPLELGGGHDPVKVLAFLDEWKPKPLDAESVLADALQEAATHNKRIFAHFGTPSCGWCRKLEAFLAREDVAKLMDVDYVEVKIDLVRMTHGRSVQDRYRPSGSGGVPWFVILDKNGKALANADGPNGNVGYPVKEAEVAHFMSVIGETKQRLTTEQVKELEMVLSDIAREILAKRANRN